MTLRVKCVHPTAVLAITLFLCISLRSQVGRRSMGCFSRTTGQPVSCSNPVRPPAPPAPPQPSEEELRRAADEKDLREATDDAWDKGVAAYKTGDFDNAVRWFEQALRYDRDRPEFQGDDPDLLQNLQAAQMMAAKAKQPLPPPVAPTPASPPVQPPAPAAPAPRTYTYSGNAFIGGTSWIAGFNVQNPDPALVAKSHAMLKRQMELAGVPYSAGIDFKRYNFVLGIGESTSIFFDLKNRVLFDEFTKGQFSAKHQALYDSLKGREFTEMGCHSNGAMVCLVALMNKDVKVKRVALYGPQLTRESLRMWEELIKTGQVESVHIYVNQNDPVPPFSIAFGDLFRNDFSNAALLKLSVLKQIISSQAADIALHSHACGLGLPTLDCHDMARYKSERGCITRPKGGTVPGTALPGKGNLQEPPPPC